MEKVLKSSLQFSAQSIFEFILTFVPQTEEDLPFAVTHKPLWSKHKDHPVTQMFKNIGFTMEYYSLTVTKTDLGPVEYHLTLDPRGWQPKWRPMVSYDTMADYFPRGYKLNMDFFH